MKTSSCKAKGRRCSSEFKELILQYMHILKDDDIFVTSSGETGVDLKLSALAKLYFPFAIECKNVEKLNVWDALEQAESHKTEGMTPILVFKRNRSEMYVALKAKDFMEVICTRYLSVQKN